MAIDLQNKNSINALPIFQNIEQSPLEIPVNPAQPKEREIYSAFDRDIIENPSIPIQLGTSENSTPSIWNKLISWWKGTDKDASPISSRQVSSEKEHVQPVNPRPTLAPPTNNSYPLDDSLVKRNAHIKKSYDPIDIQEGLSLMDERTLEEIMPIIFKSQAELEKENANVIEGTSAKYRQFQELQQKMLQEMKDTLAKNEKIGNRLNTMQSITVGASLISGMATAALSFHLLGPASSFLQAVAGPSAAALLTLFTSIAAKAGPGISAGLAALSTGTKTYFTRKRDEHKAKHIEYEHANQCYNDDIDHSNERFMQTAEADSVFKEHWIRFLKRLDKMRKIILKK